MQNKTQILSPIPVLRLISSLAFLLSLRRERMRRHSWAQPKGWDREERPMLVQLQFGSLSEISLCFPLICHLCGILEPEALTVHQSRQQSLKSRLAWLMAGLCPDWDLVPISPLLCSPPARCTCTAVLGTC